MAAGYDIGASLSNSESSAASLNDAFNVTGGGNQNSIALIAIIAGVAFLSFFLWISFRK